MYFCSSVLHNNAPDTPGGGALFELKHPFLGLVYGIHQKLNIYVALLRFKVLNSNLSV